MRKSFISTTIKDIMDMPLLAVSDDRGNIFEIPHLCMAGVALAEQRLPVKDDLIPLPHGSNLFMLPGRLPTGYDPETRRFVSIDNYQGEKINAVAAFMAPAYVQFLLPAYTSTPSAPRLPLYCYTAVGWYKGKFYVPAARIDADTRQDLRLFDEKKIERGAQNMLHRYPRNRLVGHLVEKCVRCYGCPAARNFVMERWECPVPTSPACNAGCVGCISLQPRQSNVVSSQERIDFTPTVAEIIEFTVPHLEQAPRAVISFGQGCEGEPLLEGELIAESIKQIRSRTKKGIINLNTNGSRPETLKSLFEAGLDSIRVSLNSAQDKYYNAYYNPRDYKFDDVVQSLTLARDFNRWSSLNYLIFPGFTDHKTEMAALHTLINKVKPNMIQTRNLNIDPEWYTQELKLAELAPDFIGMRNWLDSMRTAFPWIKFGYFNPPREEMKKEHFGFTS
ncbi:MAG: radical SAM protein [Spirochaetales bacterium]|nr:radical SAM protein [Spirochaetales bacterium]